MCVPYYLNNYVCHKVLLEFSKGGCRLILVIKYFRSVCPTRMVDTWLAGFRHISKSTHRAELNVFMYDVIRVYFLKNIEYL